MNFKTLIRSFVAGIALGFLLVGGLQAQPLCGGIPSVNLNVRDSNGEPIENAAVELIPLGIDDTAGNTFVQQTWNKSLFRIKFDRFVQGDYKLVVYSEGFETAELKIKFFDCFSRTVYLISRTEKTGVIRGTIYDKNKIAVLGWSDSLSFSNEKRIRFDVIPDDFGDFEIKLPFGKYNVWVHHIGLNQVFECRSFMIDRKEIEFDIYLSGDQFSQAVKDECSAESPDTEVIINKL